MLGALLAKVPVEEVGLMLRRPASVLVFLSVTLVFPTALSLPAAATTPVRRDPVYVDTGYDPDDVPIDEGSCCQ